MEIIISTEVFERSGIDMSPDDLSALTALLIREEPSPAEHYFDPDTGLHKIVLAGEEPSGFYTRPQNLVINWREVMGTTLPNAVFAAVSAAQLPWLTPFAVLAIIWDTRSKMKVPLKAEHAIVLRAVWECGGHATETKVSEAIARHYWKVPGSTSTINIPSTLDQLANAGLVEIIDGKAKLIDSIVIRSG